MILSVIRVTPLFLVDVPLALSFLSLKLYIIFKDSFVGNWGTAFSHSLPRHFYFDFWSYVAFSDTKNALGD